MTKSSKRNLLKNTLESDNSISNLVEHTRILWGKQTELSLTYFTIGKHNFEQSFIDALVSIKRACAQVNHDFHFINNEQFKAIIFACNELLKRKYTDQFPLRIWQTGSGTQTNMNVNEVIASLANSFLLQNKQDGNAHIHPNDHINMSQSSNDVFPTAMHIVVAQQTVEILLPTIKQMERELSRKKSEFECIDTVGRTHLMDALPIKAGALLSAHESQLIAAKKAIRENLNSVYQLALGGTAVGSGANAPELFGQQAITLLSKQYQLPFIQHANLYAAVSGEDALIQFSGSLKQLAAALFKIANDFRLLGSGPRCGLNEWHLPANEPGSSIIPGKVNPTQCEALSMVCLQVFGNDLTVSLAASNGQLQLNTYRPVIIHNILESIELLADAMNSFSKNTLQGLKLNRIQTDINMRSNLSAITLLAPKLGYDLATKIVQRAVQKDESLAIAAESLGLYNQTEFERLMDEQLNIQISPQKISKK